MFKSGNLGIIDKIALLFSSIFILAGSIVSVLRYWQYEVFYYDFGVFDTAIWKVAHFQKPIIDHFIVAGKIIFADHFNPSIFLLSPLYWFTDKQEALLITQSLIVGLSGLVIYIIAKKVFRDAMSNIPVYWTSLTVLISYFLFIGLQNAVISDFHEVTIATLPFSLMFYSLIKKNIKWFVIFGILTLGFKESLFLLGIVMGVFTILFDRKLFKLGVATSIFSLIYGLFVIKFLIPHFSGGVYVYGENIVLEPVRFVTLFFDSPIKLDTMLKSFWSFSFLPIFSPMFYILILQDFGVRFYSAVGDSRIQLGLHYNAILSVIMAISSIYGLKFIRARLNKSQFKFLLIFIILNSIFLYRFITHGPFALSYNPAFYQHTKDFEFLNKMVSLVPKNASVMTQNNIGPHLTHQTLWNLRMKYEELAPDYILIDTRPNQNANDFFGSSKNFRNEDFIEKVSGDKCYKTIYKTKYQFVFKNSC